MSFEARVFRILIASPSDVAAERMAIVEAIQSWNDANSPERRVVLLPVRWETHSHPEYGQRPQAILNRQIVDTCDLLIGVFWTRLGTSTGEAESGTLEEIERIAAQNRPVLLYFSNASKNPYDIDLAQLERLRKFKEEVRAKALPEEFSELSEFRDKLKRNLEATVRQLMSTDATSEDVAGSPPDIKISFADLQTGASVGNQFKIKTKMLVVSGLEEVPDYGKPDPEEKVSKHRFSFDEPDKDYYRKLIEHIKRREYYHPVRFALENDGSIGARDIYVEMPIRTRGGPIWVASLSKTLSAKPKKSSYQSWFEADEIEQPTPGPAWTSSFNLPALQPKRRIARAADFAVGADQNETIDLEATIYADVLARPSVQKLTLNIEVEKVEARAIDLLRSSGEEIELPKSKPAKLK